ncbi:MAG: hypothetical protein ACFFAN_20310 [Promethearchaeota archaeon]
MSYIEIKSRNKIFEIFNELSDLDNALLEQLNFKKSVIFIDEIAKLCANFNKNINLILKKYYPEIKELTDKLNIKSSLKFYYDLIEKLTDLIRNNENFQKFDEKYYKALIEFINEKESLITGKYKEICSKELLAFYNQNSRQNLEKVLKIKIKQKNQNSFRMGSLEEQIKKMAKGAGADLVSIYSAEILKDGEFSETSTLFGSAKTVISFAIGLVDDIIMKHFSKIHHEEFSLYYNEEKIGSLLKIGKEIINFLISKKYKAIQLTEEENGDFNLLKKNNVSTHRKIELSYTSSIITDAKLIPDRHPEI